MNKTVLVLNKSSQSINNQLFVHKLINNDSSLSKISKKKKEKREN